MAQRGEELYGLTVYESQVVAVKRYAKTPVNVEIFILSRLRGRMHQLGTAEVFQWSQLPQDASAFALEAGPGVAPCCVSPPSLVPRPSSLVYRDETLAPTARP